MVNKKQMKKIEKLVAPMVKFLRKNLNPYATIVITANRVRLEETSLSIPFNYQESNPPPAQLKKCNGSCFGSEHRMTTEEMQELIRERGLVVTQKMH